jgi:hypothetical protein
MGCNNDKELRREAERSSMESAQAGTPVQQKSPSARCRGTQTKENAMQSLSWELCLHAVVSFGGADQAVSAGRSPW